MQSSVLGDKAVATQTPSGKSVQRTRVSCGLLCILILAGCHDVPPPKTQDATIVDKVEHRTPTEVNGSSAFGFGSVSSSSTSTFVVVLELNGKRLAMQYGTDEVYIFDSYKIGDKAKVWAGYERTTGHPLFVLDADKRFRMMRRD